MSKKDQAQARKFRDTVDLSDSFMCADNSVNAKKDVGTVEVDVCTLPGVDLPIGKPMLIEAQCADQTLSHCVEAAVMLTDLSEHPVASYFKDDMLMCKWSPHHAEND